MLIAWVIIERGIKSSKTYYRKNFLLAQKTKCHTICYNFFFFFVHKMARHLSVLETQMLYTMLTKSLVSFDSPILYMMIFSLIGK